MDWKKVVIQSGGKLFQAHNFTYIAKGTTFNIEVDVYHDGSCTAHGEQSTDKNLVIESVSGKSVEDCLSSIIAKINQRLV
ncbi:MAG: hypothetical protein NT027_01355 [Proteobacteria bacterium]|nr:hypothetical protein [Pseudomonadota bacterium]